MSVLSLVWGILAIVGMFVAATPCLGSLNWINIPFSGIGFILSIIALATNKDGKRGPAIGGLILCLIAVVFGVVRLVVGGGAL